METDMRGFAWLLLFSLPLVSGCGSSSDNANAPTHSIAPGTTGAITQSGGLKYLTLNFNDEIVLADGGEVLRDMRFKAITDWVEKNQPDVITMQEVWNYRGHPSVATVLGQELGYDVAYRLGVGVPGLEYDSNAILAKKKFHMSGEEDTKLPHSAISIGNGKGWIIALGAATWSIGVKLTMDDGKPLYVYTSHLLGDTPKLRGDQFRAIQALIKKRLAKDGISWDEARVIFSGDTNSEPTEPGPKFMVAEGYADTWAETHPGDPGLTDCSLPESDWFNPMSIGGRQFPSQNDEGIDERIDYVFAHGDAVSPRASTLEFTRPYMGVWMSDHYGLFATLGGDPNVHLANLARDSEETGTPTEIRTIGDELWDCDHSPETYAGVCDRELPEATVTGPRGFTFLNRSSYVAEVTFDGPGPVFTSKHATLDPKEQGTFVFVVDGDYKYRVENVVLPDYRADFHGVVHVRMDKSSTDM
jgi:endonuclease/exonuclease/phosphatase family metal-dependent hydrolase